MKKILTSLLTLAAGFQLAAANDVTATLKSATVFLRGAELSHTASAKLDKGQNELYIDGLSSDVDLKSLSIKICGGATVLSQQFTPNYLKEDKARKAVQALRDSISFFEKEVKTIEAEQRTATELLDLLRANRSIGGAQTGVSVAELAKMVEFYKKQSVELEQQKNQCEERKTKANEQLKRLRSQLAVESRKNDTVSGRLLLKLLSPATSTFTFDITYYTNKAQWSPTYDIIATGTQQPIKIVYKANLVQTTGVDWKGIQLTLSTGTPSQKVAPIFSTWFLRPTVIYGTARKAAPMAMMSQNRISYAEEEMDMPNMEMVMSDASSSMSSYVSSSANEIDVTYNVSIPYDVLGNGNPQSLEIKSVEVPAKFRYYSAPKLDKGVFLLAAISDWQKLDLMSGQANITFEGTYVGSSYIDPANTREELDLTLGQDSRIVVKREKMQDFSSVKFLGNDKRQEFSYKTTVKNTRNIKSHVILKDQYPISTTKEITVEVLDTGSAHVNKEVGTLTWEFDLEPGETREFVLKYAVKYPKDANVNL
jgi:uncharacterized protein (TIGR02231 family)